MYIFKIPKIIDRLHLMIDNAIAGRPVENSFDETKMSALETKLSHYLAANRATRIQLAEEKSKINQLISDISHQTKTPVANILLYAQLLNEGALPPKEQQCVQALIEQADKLNFLIASLVKMSRLETGMIAVAPKRGQVQTLLDNIVRQARPKAEAKGITLTCEPANINAQFDPKWTAEALYNILENAVKYTPNGGNIEIRIKAYELFARIDIQDTGPGIEEEETAKIFTRFYRSPAVSATEGAGIGLYLAREIISAGGGYIKVETAPGQGSTFSVFLTLEN